MTKKTTETQHDKYDILRNTELPKHPAAQRNENLSRNIITRKDIIKGLKILLYRDFKNMADGVIYHCSSVCDKKQNHILDTLVVRTMEYDIKSQLFSLLYIECSTDKLYKIYSKGNENYWYDKASEHTIKSYLDKIQDKNKQDEAHELTEYILKFARNNKFKYCQVNYVLLTLATIESSMIVATAKELQKQYDKQDIEKYAKGEFDNVIKAK
jgi:hypothetical protein